MPESRTRRPDDRPKRGSSTGAPRRRPARDPEAEPRTRRRAADAEERPDTDEPERERAEPPRRRRRPPDEGAPPSAPARRRRAARRDEPEDAEPEEVEPEEDEPEEDDDFEDDEPEEDEEPEEEDEPEAAQRPRIDAAGAARRAAVQVQAMTGRSPEGVTAVERTEDGWRVGIEVVESRRIPDSTDILALYRVDLTPDGDLLAYRRDSRYHRGRFPEEEQ
ncbi:gas vesicle protein GvpO [Kitasatospora sp. NPDC001540]|uniref:gas vesicle protein GvpO n=1 Tax=Kitasatospora sp. NPDC001540 TaxID=3364014 RepID=UPI0036B9E414